LVEKDVHQGLGVGRRSRRPDERDIVFARMAYTPGGAAFEDYYLRHPELRAVDDALRALPGLCADGSRSFHPLNARIAPAVFALLASWRPLVAGGAGGGERGGERGGAHGGPPADGADALGFSRIEVSDDETRRALTARVKGLARYFGALDVGVTLLTPDFVYSHAGRHEEDYGREISLDHTHAIVFTVEMDFRFMKAAPGLPVVTESSRRYLEAAKVALALAANVRALGWSARAHIDGSYLAVLPPLAARAGLGEIGRLGILVTEHRGPCVRLGLVTTDLPLVPDEPRPFGLQDFCRICLKCARNCPSQAISREPVAPKEGWRISWERCYGFWRRQGTDCGMCLISCPYSKPDTPFHRFVRECIRRSDAARRVAVWGDDLFYGRRPFERWEPDWWT